MTASTARAASALVSSAASATAPTKPALFIPVTPWERWSRDFRATGARCTVAVPDADPPDPLRDVSAQRLRRFIPVSIWARNEKAALARGFLALLAKVSACARARRW